MKIKILLLVVLIVLSMTNNAQELCAGIFNTAEEYQRNFISIAADSTQNKSVRIDDFFFRPYVWIKTCTCKQKIPKRNVFAVRMPDKKLYRIVNNENFLLLESTNICIYSQENEITVPIRTVHKLRFDRKKVTKYFFSISNISEIQSLNVANIRLALLKDKQFDNELIAHFPTDESLSAKNRDGEFELNVFLNSIKRRSSQD